MFGASGILDVNGKYYDLVLVSRELLETSLQTVQAYRMSYLLPRATVNQLYTGLIVLNCWLTVLVRALSNGRVGHERFFSLFFDCVLDLVASAGIILTVAHYYLRDYNWTIGGFWDELWVDDKWFSLAKNELQIVLVTSWIDLSTRVVFAIGLIASLADIKALLALQICSSRIQSSPSLVNSEAEMITNRPTTAPWLLMAKGIGPEPCLVLSASGASTSPPTGPRSVIITRLSLKRTHGRLTALASLIFAAWGFVVMVLHLHASSIPSLTQCELQVRPWGSAIPHCYLVRLDCDQLGIAGTSQEIDAQWRQFGPTAVERILIRHCSALEVPDLLQDFGAMNALKVYNSSIVRWGSDAAITATHHPHVALVYLVRVSVPNGAVPDGLLSTDTPLSLQELTVCVSNLRELPDDLHTRWPKGIAINLELSELTVVPECLLRLEPRSLSLYGNPIASLPAALFEIEGMTDLDVGDSDIVALPHGVTALSSTLKFIYFPNTQVSVLWAWIDPLILRAATDMFWSVYAGSTPYCAQYERVLNGSASNFSVQPAATDEPYSMLMDAENYWESIYVYVTCDMYFAQPFFPLSTEDAAAAPVAAISV